jgi:hypothetical protein
MEIQINTNESEFHNVVDTIRGLEVRPGLCTILQTADLFGTYNAAHERTANGPTTSFIFGFSVESANSGQVFNYLFDRAANGFVYQHIYDEQMYWMASEQLGTAPILGDIEPFAVAVNYNQIIVSSASIPFPLWGFIGGTLVKAEKQPSINPDTPNLTLYPGRVASFADRFVWAYANQISFSDPGTEPRTICGPNTIAFGGTVLDMFQAGEGGSLIVVCTDATYTIPPDGLSGYQFQGVIGRMPGYQGAYSNNAATARGTSIGLIKDGIITIGDFLKRPLTTYRNRHYQTEAVGPGASGDYRTGTIFGTDDGFVITIDKKSAFIDIDTGKITWIYPSQNYGWDLVGGQPFTVVGILKDSDGKSIFLTNSAVIDMFGTVDIASTPTSLVPNPQNLIVGGGVCVNVPSDPQGSPVVREITTSADRPGQAQFSYVRSSFQTATTPPPQNALVLNTSLWSVSSNLLEREMRSRRMQRAVRVDSPDVEVYFNSGGTRIGPVIDVVTKGIGKNRPSN